MRATTLIVAGAALLAAVGCGGPAGPLLRIAAPPAPGPDVALPAAVEVWVGTSATGIRYPELHRDRFEVSDDEAALAGLAILSERLVTHRERLERALTGRAAALAVRLHLDREIPWATVAATLDAVVEAGAASIQLAGARGAFDMTQPEIRAGGLAAPAPTRVDLALTRQTDGWMATLLERPAGQPLGGLGAGPDVLASVPLRLVSNPAVCPSVPLDAATGYASHDALGLIAEAVCEFDGEPYVLVVRPGADTSWAEVADLLAAGRTAGDCAGPLVFARPDDPGRASGSDCEGAGVGTVIAATVAYRQAAREAAGREGGLTGPE